MRLQWCVCFSWLHISSILSGLCDHLRSGTREWSLFLRTRSPIQLKTRMPFLSMLRMNVVPNVDVCWLSNPKYTGLKSLTLCHGFRVQSMFLWLMWFVQWWWRIHNNSQCVWNDSWMKQLRSMLIDRRQARYAFTSWITKPLAAHSGKSQWLPLWPNGE